MYNQNSQVIHESSNVVINDISYDQDIIKSQILTQESIGDNPNDIPKRDIDPSIDEDVPLDDTPKKMRNKNRSRVPKNHLISNVIGNVNEQVVTRRQSRLNEMNLVFYTFQLDPKNMEKALGDESLTTTLQEKLN